MQSSDFNLNHFTIDSSTGAISIKTPYDGSGGTGASSVPWSAFNTTDFNVNEGAGTITLSNRYTFNSADFDVTPNGNVSLKDVNIAASDILSKVSIKTMGCVVYTLQNPGNSGSIIYTDPGGWTGYGGMTPGGAAYQLINLSGMYEYKHLIINSATTTGASAAVIDVKVQRVIGGFLREARLASSNWHTSQESGSWGRIRLVALLAGDRIVIKYRSGYEIGHCQYSLDLVPYLVEKYTPPAPTTRVLTFS